MVNICSLVPRPRARGGHKTSEYDGNCDNTILVAMRMGVFLSLLVLELLTFLSLGAKSLQMHESVDV